MPSVRALVMPVAMNASVAGRRRPAGQSGPGHWLTVIVDLAMTLSAAPHVLPLSGWWTVDKIRLLIADERTGGTGTAPLSQSTQNRSDHPRSNSRFDETVELRVRGFRDVVIRRSAVGSSGQGGA